MSLIPARHQQPVRHGVVWVFRREHSKRQRERLSGRVENWGQWCRRVGQRDQVDHGHHRGDTHRQRDRRRAADELQDQVCTNLWALLRRDEVSNGGWRGFGTVRSRDERASRVFVRGERVPQVETDEFLLAFFGFPKDTVLVYDINHFKRLCLNLSRLILRVRVSVKDFWNI